MTDIASGTVDVSGKIYWVDGNGGLIPEANVKTPHKLQDELVRNIFGRVIPLAEQVSQLRRQIFADLDAFVGLLAQEYELERGGTKGNLTFHSYDRLMKVQVQVNENIAFGPALQIAKGLVDQCLNDWVEGASDNLRAFVTRAFQTDKQGNVSPSHLFYLLRFEIADERWKQAMKAITDSIEVTGTKRYIRLYLRDNVDTDFRSITIDLAAG